MPQRGDLKKILILGSGPIVIGQACEFDYSGTQACKALRNAGYEIVLINSNPASIMHSTYDNFGDAIVPLESRNHHPRSTGAKKRSTRYNATNTR